MHLLTFFYYKKKFLNLYLNFDSSLNTMRLQNQNQVFHIFSRIYLLSRFQWDD